MCMRVAVLLLPHGVCRLYSTELLRVMQAFVATHNGLVTCTFSVTLAKGVRGRCAHLLCCTLHPDKWGRRTEQARSLRELHVEPICQGAAPQMQTQMPHAARPKLT